MTPPDSLSPGSLPDVAVSILLACRNGAATLDETLDSLAAQVWDRPWEIVYIDNGSTDGSVAVFEAAAARHPEVAMRFVDAASVAGKSRALNLGAAAAAGRSLMFCDADDTVAPGWLAAMGEALERHDFVACRFDLTRHNPDWVVASRDPFQVDSLPIIPHEPFCPVAGGASLGMHRAVYEGLGGFDPDFPTSEDTDFCIRAHLAGYRLAFVPEAIYHYRLRDDMRAIRRQAHAYARSEALLRARYMPAQRFLARGPWRTWAVETARLVGQRLKARATGRQETEAQRARATERLGRAFGELGGSIAYRVPPRRPKRPSAIVSVRTRENLLALTFDDGPDPDWTPRLLDLLARHGAKATFFMVGSRAARHPELVARVAAEGHEIGNHTWDHPSLPGIGAEAVADQLERTRAALAPHGQTLLRPPYGHQDRTVDLAARRFGYRTICWHATGEDWLDRDAATIAGLLLDKAEPGAILLLHDSLYSWEEEAVRDRTPTIEAVGTVIARLPGWRFVTVSELMAAGAVRERVWENRPGPDFHAALKTAEPA